MYGMGRIRIAKWAEIRRVTKAESVTRYTKQRPYRKYETWVHKEHTVDIADRKMIVGPVQGIGRSDSAFADHDPFPIPPQFKGSRRDYQNTHAWRFLYDEKKGVWSEVLASAPEVNVLWKTISWPRQMRQDSRSPDTTFDWTREDIATTFEYLALGESEAYAERHYAKHPGKRDSDALIRTMLLAGEQPADIRKALEAEFGPYVTIPAHRSKTLWSQEIPEQKPDDQWSTDWSRATCTGPCSGPIGCRWCY